MGFLEKLGGYEWKFLCSNCDTVSMLKIPRGTRVKEFLDNNKAKCKNCGCLIEKV